MATAKIWMWSSLGLVLLVGLCLGVVADRLLLQPQAVFADATPQKQAPMWFICEDRRSIPIEEEPGYLYPERLRTRLLDSLSERLGMNAEQRSRLEESLEEKRHDAHEFWEGSRHAYCDLRDGFRDDIRALLDQEQKVRYDEMMVEINRQVLEKASRLRESFVASDEGD